MTTCSCKRVLLFITGIAFLVSGCAFTSHRQNSVAAASRAESVQQGPEKGIEGVVAVLTIHNMTAMPAPLKDLEMLFYDELGRNGISVLDGVVLENFMTSRRLRYTGGVDSVIASAMRDEMGVKAVFISSLEYFDEGDPPKIALHARLVSTSTDLEIQWIDSYCKAGDDSPGFFDLGIIDDSRQLMEKAAERLVRSMMINRGIKEILITGRDPDPPDLTAIVDRSVNVEAAKPITIAIIPFLNLSERSNAWEIMPLHFIHHMAGLYGFRILEPGEVRRALLNSRVFLQGGLSVPNLELVLKSTGADLVLSGTVLRYLDTRTASRDPEVEFSVRVFDRLHREVVWSSYREGRGSDGVFFFDVGRKSTACSLASTMVDEAVSGMSFHSNHGN